MTFKHQRDPDMITNVYFKVAKQPVEDALFWRGSVFERTYALTRAETWHLKLAIDSLGLASGTYDVIPYIKILQDGLPSEMLISLGENSHRYDTSYLNIPFKEKTGTLIIN